MAVGPGWRLSLTGRSETLCCPFPSPVTPTQPGVSSEASSPRPFCTQVSLGTERLSHLSKVRRETREKLHLRVTPRVLLHALVSRQLRS